MAARPRKLRQTATPTTTIVGENVYRLRVMKAPAWSRRKLEALSGVSEETIRLLEKNRIPDAEQLSPHLDTIDKLATAFEVEPDSLYRATPSKSTGQPRHLSVVPETGEALPAKR
jgi:transcriptional regulator with XRE-family HTH domain